ncbi:hypothetical protein TNCT_407521 [Trichonephila clavata]|uniref:Uncharacterized protein n=1 Tax=Trichonephila clavata TaxID=2740835 RepID=A0A8X6F7L1_TRICU|nr:hypothetical protein TNCT_407521 [Trichonephila clavata]
MQFHCYVALVVVYQKTLIRSYFCNCFIQLLAFTRRVYHTSNKDALFLLPDYGSSPLRRLHCGGQWSRLE